ncbi:Cation transporter family protein [Dictyocaulus viviparus]|uniref:Cation transporter family protein n=1 Tax=Dictyocaulus viviparus TaxID=29172 RepID=A0A0D8XDJ3_DICVI|nr:Cation transporter family protein [Dictyocaulus viviparus]
MRFSITFITVISIALLFRVFASDDEERLMMDVFRGYNSLIQPIKNLSNTPIIVKIALQLVLLINVDEKDQVMHTNVWLTLKWHDFQMRWNPVNYGEIKQIRVSPDKVWLPDIVLFNNADGNYEVSFMCNVVINYLGDMLWVPPAIYKSSCIIDVEFFPFDEQVCTLVFGSWTYNENEIKLEFEQAEWVDLSEYAPSSIWDVMDAPASLVNKRSRIEFQVRIRRKTLFYTVVLIIPTVLMAFLSMAVFFLPTDSGRCEKMTLTTSVLLSIVVFLLLVSKILPPTSSTIPLMAKYLLLTFVLNVITILVTVIIIDVYFRGPTTHRMPRWVRRLFLELMPHAMCMRRPKSYSRKSSTEKQPSTVTTTELPGLGTFNFTLAAHHPFCPSATEKEVMSLEAMNSGVASEVGSDPTVSAFYPLSIDALRAIDSIEYITDHLKNEEERKMYRDDWKYVAMIIDRLLLYVFFGITVGGTCGILFSAPYVFQGVNQREVLDRLISLYKNGGDRHV